MILQKSKYNMYVNLDAATVKFMGWQKGEEVVIDRNKKNDSITITRIKEDKNASISY